MNRFFKTVLILIFTFSAMFNAYAQRGKVVTETIQSKILGVERNVNVYVPDDFETHPEKQYPVLYLLHGLYGTNKDWTERGHVEDVMARVLRSGEAVQMVIIMPDAGGNDPMVQQNGYFNLEGWEYENFFFNEMMPALEAKYRCIGDKAHRAIAGLSMGGGGTASYAQRHPELFCAAYCMSAYFGERQGVEIDAQGKVLLWRKSAQKLNCIEFVENADEATVAALKTVDWFIDCGDDDFLILPNMEMIKALKQKGIPCECRMRDGSHDWEYWHSALYTALPRFSRIFSRQ